jgi:hypothetical protein
MVWKLRAVGLSGEETVDVVEDCVIRWRPVVGRGVQSSPNES